MSDAGNAPMEVFDRRLVTERRERAAPEAEAHEFLLARAADEIIDRLAFVNRKFPVAAVVGAHHGLVARRLGQVRSIGAVIAVESAPALLAQCPAPKVLADEELLPFRDGALDLVVSALSLQLVNDLPGTLVQIRRALKPDGLFLAAMLGGETLRELREALLLAEAEVEGGASPRVAPFADVRDLGGLLQRAGFALPVADTDLVTVTYDSPLKLMQDLRGMGGTNALVARRRTPLKRATLFRMLEIYADRFGSGRRVPATFEIVTLTGWVPHESQQKPLRPGSAQARLADALGVKEHKTGEQ